MKIMMYFQWLMLMCILFNPFAASAKSSTGSKIEDIKEDIKRGQMKFGVTQKLEKEMEKLKQHMDNNDAKLMKVKEENAALKKQLNEWKAGARIPIYKIAFMGISTKSFSGSRVVPFNVIQTNEGGAFSSNGRFTAPVKGVYYFNFHGLKQFSTSYTGLIYLRLNGAKITSAYAYQPYKSEYSALAVSATLVLNKNNYVDIYLPGYYIYSDSNRYMTFSGGLLFPL